jgi:hypothetical protein
MSWHRNLSTMSWHLSLTYLHENCGGTAAQRLIDKYSERFGEDIFGDNGEKRTKKTAVPTTNQMIATVL